VQLGEAEDEEKPKFASIPSGTSLEAITLEQALGLFKLPRTLGTNEAGDDIEANIGRFGPYVKVGKQYVSLGEHDPYTVDLATATWKDTIGAPQLVQTWTDPEFDPAQRAFYYARVLEIPTPRWTAYDAKNYKLKLPKEVPMTTQERAYTSPIWYTPAG